MKQIVEVSAITEQTSFNLQLTHFYHFLWEVLAIKLTLYRAEITLFRLLRYTEDVWLCQAPKWHWTSKSVKSKNSEARFGLSEMIEESTQNGFVALTARTRVRESV